MRRLLTSAIFCWLALANIAAAEDTTRPWAFLSADANAATAPTAAPPLDLRSNVTQPLYLYVVNPTEDVPTLSIEVRSGGTVVAVAEDRAPGNSTRRVALKPAPGLNAPNGVDLSSMQFTISVANKNKTTEASNDSVQGVKLRNPASFLSDTTATFFGTDNKLVVKVAANDFQGPPCPVELAIATNDVPGLVKEELKGVTRGMLSAQQKEVTLVASGLAGASGEGQFALTVDGVERAIVFRGNFKVAPAKSRISLCSVNEQGVTVEVPAFARPGQDVIARVATNNATDSAKLTLTFGQGEKNNRIISQTFTHIGPRDQGAAVTTSPDGFLNVTTRMLAWAPHLDTRGIYGPCTVVASMTTDNTTEGHATIILDDTAPKGEFEGEAGKPLQCERGQPMTLKLTAEDPDSGIRKVEVFVGAEPPAPAADGKVPAEPKGIVAEPVASETAGQTVRNFVAKVQIPDSKVPVPVFARFTNGVGMTNVKHVNVVLVDPPTPLGSIKGQVFHGTLLQKNLTVTLYTPKWEVVKTAALDKDGFFEFKDLTPGDYKLGSEMPARKLKGYAAVTVKAAKAPLEVKLDIKQ